MPAVVGVGVQWGDEGKGKVVDILAEHADIVVRYQGGSNAGHTLVVSADRAHRGSGTRENRNTRLVGAPSRAWGVSPWASAAGSLSS